MMDIKSKPMTALAEETHSANIGRIVRALACHEPGDWGDCSINDPIVSIVDRFRPAHELVAALAEMDADTAAGIVAQLAPLKF